jgi:hypothetical protein
MTESLLQGRPRVELVEDLADPSSLLDTTRAYPESDPPAIISTDMHRWAHADFCISIILTKRHNWWLNILANISSHQKQALSFMLAREQGWDYHSNEHDLFKAEETPEGIK